MTDRNDLPEYGGWGGNDFGRHSCPDGEVIKTISGRAGQAVDQICARCTDGTELGCYGGGNGSPWSRDGPFTSAYGRSGDGVDSLFGSGGNGGNGWSGICPTGKYLTGIRGRGAELVDRDLASVQAVAALAEDHRPGRAQLHAHRHRCQHRRDQQQDEAAQHQVAGALDGRVGA